MNKRSDPLNLAQQRRDIREQRDADCRTRVIAAHTRRIAKMGDRLFPASAGLHAQAHASVVAWCEAHPDRGATIEQVCTHEAAHFVAAAKLGLVPTHAEVRGALGSARGYGGSVWAQDRPASPEARGAFTADDVLHEAGFALAGPLAEWWLAGGDPYASPSEMLEASLCAAHLADMIGLDRVPVLADVFTLAMQIVVTFREQIEQITGVLKRKRRIIYATRGVVNALKGIGSAGLTSLIPLDAEEDKALGEMMLRAPIDLARFTEEVGR